MILDFTISNFRSIKEAQTISFEATKDTHLEDYFIIKKDKYRIKKGKCGVIKENGFI